MFKLENQYDKLVCTYATKTTIALAHTYSARKFTPVDCEIAHKTASMRNNSPLEIKAPVSKAQNIMQTRSKIVPTGHLKTITYTIKRC